MAIEFLDDVSTGNITIGGTFVCTTNSPTFTNASSGPSLTVEQTLGAWYSYSTMKFYKNIASGGSTHEHDIGQFQFTCNNISGTEKYHAKYFSRTLNRTAGSESTETYISLLCNGAEQKALGIKGDTEINLLIGSETASTAPGILKISDGATNSVGFKTTAALAATTVYTLPDADGTNGQVLSTDGSLNLSWATGGSGGTNIGNSDLYITPDNAATYRRLYLSSTGGSFSIYKQQGGTGIIFTTSTSSVASYRDFKLISLDSSSKKLVFQGDSNAGSTNVISLQAPTSIIAPNPYILPAAYPAAGIPYMLSSTTTGTMSWVAQQNLANTNQTLASTRSIALGGYELYIRKLVTGDFVMQFGSNGDVTIHPADTHTSNTLYFKGSSGNAYKTGIRSGNATADTVYTLPIDLPTASGKYLSSSTTGVMSWGAPSSHIVSGGGTVDITTSSHTGKLGLLFGGSGGFCDTRWDVEASATNPGTVMVPGTTTYAGVIPNNIMGAIFNANASGIVKISGTMKFDTDTQTGKDIIVRVYKVPTAFITDMANGDDPGTTMGNCILVAGVKIATPSSSPSTRPMSYTSTNGVSVASTDFLFATFTYRGKLPVGSSGTSIVNNFQLMIL